MALQQNEISGSTRIKLDDILSSSLNNEDLPLGALLFEKDGTMRSIIACAENDADRSSVGMAMDYINFAFERSDWMLEYVNQITDAYVDVKRRSTFRLIKGGLSEVSDDS